MLNQVLGAVKNSTQSTGGTADTITKVGGGAAVAGILSMILGRNGGSNLAKLGSLAALGSLAYKAYQNYQQNNGQAQNLPAENFEEANVSQEAGVIILRTMIAAAACDGEIDEQEYATIAKEAQQSPELEQWLHQEIQQPISTAEIAQTVGHNPALAAQVYLAARLVCGADLSRKEIVFLAQLSTALNLDDSLVEQLEKQAGF
ncbi:3-hydroxyisobutyrate dehydrogenase [Pasteurellaceae bacterium RH1A]|nr:3-hydroxyisobutyrate dehydrogenase [Pasteurellaceae bacterium RH1A]